MECGGRAVPPPNRRAEVLRLKGWRGDGLVAGEVDWRKWLAGDEPSRLRVEGRERFS